MLGLIDALRNISLVLLALGLIPGLGNAQDNEGSKYETRGRSIRLADQSVADVRDAGAEGDGVHDDTDAVSGALERLGGGGMLYFPPGIYRISREIEVRSNVKIACNSATILSDVVIRSYFHFTRANNLIVQGCVFDQRKDSLPLYSDQAQRPQNVALYFDEGSSDIFVYDNTFLNLYTNAVRFYHTNGQLYVAGNTFRSGVQRQMLVLDHIQIVTATGDIEIRRNTFANTAAASPEAVPSGMLISGTKGRVTVDANTFDYCGRDNTGHHRVGVIDFYGNSENVVVSNNKSTNTMAQFIRLAASWPARITGNAVERHANAERGTTISVEAAVGFRGVGRVGATEIEIAHNELVSAAFDNYGIAVTSYDYAVPSKDISIHHNVLRDFRAAIMTGGPFDHLDIVQNSIGGERYAGGIRIRGTGGGITMSSALGVSEERSMFSALSIEDNRIKTVDADAVPIDVDLRTPSSVGGRVGTISVVRNNIHSVESRNGVAIVANAGRATPDGELIVRQNEVSDFAGVFQAVGFKEEVSEGNRILAK